MKKLFSEPMTWFVVAIVPGLLALAMWVDAISGYFRIDSDATLGAIFWTAVAGGCFLRGYFLKQEQQGAGG
jgi:hypothetical protein